MPRTHKNRKPTSLLFIQDKAECMNILLMLLTRRGTPECVESTFLLRNVVRRTLINRSGRYARREMFLCPKTLLRYHMQPFCCHAHWHQQRSTLIAMTLRPPRWNGDSLIAILKPLHYPSATYPVFPHCHFQVVNLKTSSNKIRVNDCPHNAEAGG